MLCFATYVDNLLKSACCCCRSSVQLDLAHLSSTMKRTVVLLVVSLALLAHLASATVPEDLEKNGLPVGLLPGSVKSYTLNEDGTFVVYLEKPCYAKIDDQVYFLLVCER